MTMRHLTPAKPQNWDARAIDKPLTPADLQRIREAAYRSKGWRLEEYRYPAGARLHARGAGKAYPLPGSNIGHAAHKTVLLYANHARDRHPTADIYITIPSKANTQ